MQQKFSNRTAWLMIMLFLGSGAVLTSLSFYYYQASIAVFLSLFLGYLFHGLTFSLLMLVLSYWGLKAYKAQTLPVKPPSVTVAVPVFNEGEVIVLCIESLLKQSLKPSEIIVTNDGSTDNLLKILKQTYQLYPITNNKSGKIKTKGIINIYHSNLVPTLKVIDKERGGKADGLNAALNLASGEVFISVDADSFLHVTAIERLISGLCQDKDIIAAGGTVKAANGIPPELLVTADGRLPQGLLPKIQWLEYATGFVWRFGWTFMNTLLLLSGSFSAFRTAKIRECQGFDTQSLTEDYEMAYRLHAYHRSHKIPYRMITVPDALAYTLVPNTVNGLLRQRIRWFQGFIQTLFSYRSLIFQQTYGILGIFMLPIKCIDAISPIWSIFSYLMLIYYLVYRPLPLSIALLLGIAATRWIIDLIMAWVLLALHQRHILPRISRRELAYLYLITPIYILSSQWLWYAYSLGAYYRALIGIRRWDKSERQGFSQLTPQARDIVQ